VSQQGERRTMRQNIRELPKPAWILIGGNFINWFASFAITFLVLYLTRRGVSFARAGLAVAAFGAGGMAAGVLGGHLADRLGRRNTMAVSMFVSAASVLLLYYVHAYVAILVLAFVVGVATDTWRPASRALMADVVPEGQRVTAYALVRFFGHVGFAAGAALAGFLAEHHIVWVFLSDAVTSVAFGVLAWTSLPEGRRATREEDQALGGGYRRVVTDRAFVLLFLASMFVAFIYAQQQTTLPLHVVGPAHLTTSDFGFLLALNGVLVIALELPISSLTMRRPPKQMIALGFLLFGVGFGLTAWARSEIALLGTVAIWTLGEMISAPIAYAYLADIAPEHLRGRYQGLYELSWGIGGVAGPALGAVVFGASPTGLWMMCGAMGLAAAALVLSIPDRVRVADPTILLPEVEPTTTSAPLETSPPIA
jgi:MFS family permease